MTRRLSRVVVAGYCVLMLSSGVIGLPSAWGEPRMKTNPCALLTEADFMKVTGRGLSPHAPQLTPEELGPGSAMCHFSGAGGVDVEVILGPGAPKAHFEKMIKKEERISGVGDIAGFRELHGQVAVETLVGQHSMRLGFQSDGATSKPLKEIAIGLAKAAAERLR